MFSSIFFFLNINFFFFIQVNQLWISLCIQELEMLLDTIVSPIRSVVRPGRRNKYIHSDRPRNYVINLQKKSKTGNRFVSESGCHCWFCFYYHCNLTESSLITEKSWLQFLCNLAPGFKDWRLKINNLLWLLKCRTEVNCTRLSGTGIFVLRAVLQFLLT